MALPNILEVRLLPSENGQRYAINRLIRTAFSKVVFRLLIFSRTLAKKEIIGNLLSQGTKLELEMTTKCSLKPVLASKF